ncbi:putative C-type lectin domain family 20 member A isoform X1, partial [Clarias magur]
TKTGIDSFIFITTGMSWYDAQIYCRLHYTDMASIKNTAENSFIGGLSAEFSKQQQIIRVKVNSSQDVNDPAVMAAFLEK